MQREWEDVALTTCMDGVGTMAERGVATSGTQQKLENSLTHPYCPSFWVKGAKDSG